MGEVGVGGQDGDIAALNRVALGTQIVSVLKDASELGTAAGEAALQLCENPDISQVEGAVAGTSTGGLDTYSVLLDPLPITQDNLQDALDLRLADSRRAVCGRGARVRSTSVRSPLDQDQTERPALRG